MLSKFRRATEIYRKDGMKTLLEETGGYVKYASEGIYWNVKNEYKLNAGTVTATFDAPNREIVKREKWRFGCENEMLNDLVEELETSDVFYDVGAHIGLYTCFASHACPDGTVVAFEPYSPNMKQLKKNVARNKPEKVTLVDKALSNKKEQVTFSQPKQEVVGHGTGSIGADNEGGSVVDTVEGDRLVEEQEVPQPTVVKIDVEGAEGLVIDGLRNALSDDDCRLVYCEVHPTKHIPLDDENKSNALAEISRNLSNFGFDIESTVERHGQVHLKAVK